MLCTASVQPAFLPHSTTTLVVQALIGQQLEKYELEEAEVLKGITKVRSTSAQSAPSALFSLLGS